MSDRPEAEEHHRILLSNCLAQAQALAHGKQADNPKDVFQVIVLVTYCCYLSSMLSI